jgi:DNA-binding beta-propeller fold protein YncE
VWRCQTGVRLADGFRGEEIRAIRTYGVMPCDNGMAVSRDGSTLLVSDHTGGSHAIHEFRVADGSLLRIVGEKGRGPLQFMNPRQVSVAPDDFVFVADCNNSRVQVLTPRLDFHAIVGEGHVRCPHGVCADDAIIVVSEADPSHRISVFKRGDGALLRRFGSQGTGDGQLYDPTGLCFLSGGSHVAVVDGHNHRVSIFSVDGEFARHVGVGQLKQPEGVAASAFDEIVVADRKNQRAVVFSASGELLKTMDCGYITGVAVHGDTIFAQGRSVSAALCFLFK